MSDEVPRGAITRARMSVAAIRVIAQMRKEGRAVATSDERQVLLGWSGWGPLAPMFAPNTQTWLDLHNEVKALITPDEWDIGGRSTYTAFYTPNHVAQTMWKLLADLGFTSGKVLEPGCGGGAFIGTAPAGAQMIGVDRDPIAAAITRALYPDAEILTSRFEAAELEGGYDAAIGNVPFGKVAVHDPTAPRAARSSLHNYFIWRAVHELAPGGIAVLLTSRYTMDAAADYARLNIGHLADFVGAVRLPNGGLEGGTEALADIIVLRRSTDRRPIPSDVDTWKDTHALDAGLSVNNYWTNRPEMVLGTMRKGETTAYGLGVAVDGDLAALPDQLRTACGVIAGRAAQRGLLWQPAENPAALDLEGLINPDGWHDGSFRFVGRDVIQMVDGRRKRVNASAELRHLMQLRDLAVNLVGLEADHDLPDEKIDGVRASTRACYEAYLAAYGPINRSSVEEDTLPVERAKPTGMQTAASDALKRYDDDFGLTGLVDEPEVTFKLVTPRLGGFRKDPDFQLVAALERYNDDTGEHSPAPILAERQNRRVVLPESTDDPMQALAWSMDRKAGRVDLPFIARALGTSLFQVPGLLGDAVYCDPETRDWQVAGEYLSGHVRAKLRTALVAAAADPAFERNVKALEGVLPTWLGPDKIKVKMSAVWITEDVVEKFVEHLLGSGARIKRLEHGNKWEIKGGRRGTPAASVQWGTPRRSAFDLVEDALNNRVPVVKTPVLTSDGRDVMRKDFDQSMRAGQKKQEIEREFARWLWTDAERTNKLVDAYNETYNATVARTFDGSHITIAGLAPWFKPYPHQLDFVARGIATRASLCAHPVGAGKTATMAMLAMKLRQLGLINLPMIAVPKHLLEQTAREMRQLFPTANILAVSAESIGKNRRAFAARCATGGYDLVIITHPAFDKIRVSEVTEARYYQRQQSILDAAIRKASPTGELEAGMVKQAAKRSDDLETKIRDLRHRKVAQDVGITFEQLGVDWLGIDEAHRYKSLALPVSTEGFTVRPSKRALDLDLKLYYLSTLSGNPYGALFTGTPISNTMLELYVVLHYLMTSYLQKIGLGSADSWASTFVEFVTSVDVTVDGGGFNLKTRPALFINAPELRMLLSLVADVRTREQLGLKVPEMVEEIVSVPATTAQAEYSTELVQRAEDVRSKGRYGDMGTDNMLKICTDGRMMATDPRLVGIQDPEPGKLHAVAAKILEKWREHPDKLQIAFCDIGTPNAERGDQTYGRLRRLLVEGGMPAGQIEFIHSAKNGNDKARLFSRCRTGNVSVIMGSTEKLGVGTNIQDRVIAMHHVDAPFRPADVEQRDGRGLRPGNKNQRVFVYRYVTQRTFDAYMWQLLARKIGFITQILTGSLDRTVEDVVAERVMSFASIKATATDQPLLLEQADVEGRIKQYREAEQSYLIGAQQLRAQVAGSSQTVAGFESDLRMWELIAAGFTGEFTDEDMATLADMCDRQWDNRIRTVAGLRVSMGTWYDSKRQRQPQLQVWGGERVRKVDMHSFQKAQSYRSALVDVANRAHQEPGRIRKALANHRQDVAAAETLLARPFEYAAELTAALARLDQIEAELHDAATAAQEREVTETDREAIKSREAEIETATLEQELAAAVNGLLASLRQELAAAVHELLADFRK
jgi:N12 class adenine-specific DNA methylase